jgi:ectoine hydroxylase-related dioxygenase (phytanoyl-CoA dioxygenase family)
MKTMARTAVSDDRREHPHDDAVRAFRRDGHVRLHAFYRPDEITRLDEALMRVKARRDHLPSDVDKSLSRDMFFSRLSSEVAAFVTSPKIGAIASELLGCRRVRFIQDVLLEKDGEQSDTPWHRDSDFWSFSGIGALTLWIPLQDTSLAMSPLRYATGSHLARDPRPLHAVRKACIPLQYRTTSSALDLGDVAVHHSNILHGAGRNREAGRPRRSYAIHLIDADALVRASRFPGQVEHAAGCGWDRLRDGDRLTDEIAPLVLQ